MSKFLIILLLLAGSSLFAVEAFALEVEIQKESDRIIESKGWLTPEIHSFQEQFQIIIDQANSKSRISIGMLSTHPNDIRFPDYIEAEQPYKTHPDLDLYLTEASPHPMEQFGCTGCHSGRSRGTTFNSAVHMPNSMDSKHDWEDEYDWEKMHHWLKPMLPVKYAEASCFKCHMEKPDIKGGQK